MPEADVFRDDSFGAGNAPPGDNGAIVKVLAAAGQRNVVLVNVTQCLTGVSPLYAAGRMLADVGVVAGRDLTSEAALSKLAYLLAEVENNEEGARKVREQMGENLRGEMT